MIENKFFTLILPLLLLLTIYSGGCRSSYDRPITREVKNSGAEKKADFVKGVLIVKFVDSATQKDIDEILFRRNSSIVKPIKSGKNVYLLQLPKNRSVEEEIPLYTKESSVEYAQPNYIYRTQNRGTAE